MTKEKSNSQIEKEISNLDTQISKLDILILKLDAEIAEMMPPKSNSKKPTKETSTKL